MYGWFCAWYCVITLGYKWFKKRTCSPENCTEHIEVGRKVSDGGKRNVLVSGIVNRGDDYNAKVQKVNDFMSEIGTRKNVQYIDNRNIGLGMLNRSKFNLNRFGTIQLVKNYREILKAWHHKEKPANESVSILKPVGPSSPCKIVKKLKNFRQPI